jgi:hypothetical protein
MEPVILVHYISYDPPQLAPQLESTFKDTSATDRFANWTYIFSSKGQFKMEACVTNTEI